MDGEKIVEAGTKLGTVVTDEDGKAVIDMDLPLMSEGYQVATNSAVATETAITLNSGDYYFKELSVSGSYYLDETDHPVHLEYQNENTEVISVGVEIENTQTTTIVSKLSVTNSEELAGCKMQIADTEGNVIVSWVSGNKDSIQLNEKLDTMGYCNVSVTLDEKGNLQINGLLHDTTYVLIENRPADGFVTADSISFQLIEGENKQTLVSVVTGEDMAVQQDNIVRMVDDTTKIRIIKLAEDTGEGMRGAKFEVYDSNNEKVLEFTSVEDGYDITGKLTVGETYTFKEVEAPKGYKLAKPVKYTIEDTAELQTISITDKKQPKPPVPQTGLNTPLMTAVLILFSLICGAIIAFCRKRTGSCS